MNKNFKFMLIISFLFGFVSSLEAVERGFHCWSGTDSTVLECFDNPSQPPVGLRGTIQYNSEPVEPWLLFCYEFGSPININNLSLDQIQFDVKGELAGTVNYQFKLQRGNCHVGCIWRNKSAIPTQWMTLTIPLGPPDVMPSCFEVISGGCEDQPPWDYVAAQTDQVCWVVENAASQDVSATLELRNIYGLSNGQRVIGGVVENSEWSLIGGLDKVDLKSWSGWACEPTNPTIPLSVELNFNGDRVATVQANLSRSDISSLCNNPNHGFSWNPKGSGLTIRSGDRIDAYALHSTGGGKTLIGSKVCNIECPNPNDITSCDLICK